MRHFVTYDVLTGVLTSIGSVSTPPTAEVAGPAGDELALEAQQLPAGEALMETDGAIDDPDLYRVSDGVIVPREASPLMLSTHIVTADGAATAVLTGQRGPMRVTAVTSFADRMPETIVSDVEAAGGPVEIAADEPCEIALSVEMAPFLPWSATVTAQ